MKNVWEAVKYDLRNRVLSETQEKVYNRVFKFIVKKTYNKIIIPSMKSDITYGKIK